MYNKDKKIKLIIFYISITVHNIKKPMYRKQNLN